jgi:hypothetical protein
MGLDPPEHRVERGAARSDGVGHRRQADRHAFACIALGLPVQRLMLAELLEQDHRQKARAGPAPGDHMERGRRLADLLAIPTGELFPYRFDHLPLPRDHLQCPRHILAQLAQPGSAAALARRRLGNHHALARQVVREGVSFGALAREARHIRSLRHGDFRGELILAGARCKFLELQRQLIDQPLRSLGARAIELTLELGDPQLLMGNQRQVFGSLGARHRQLGGPSIAFGDNFVHPRALDRQRRLQRGDVLRQRGKIGIHDRK